MGVSLNLLTRPSLFCIGDIYESESDSDDEVDPVEGEEEVAESGGDHIHEVISVKTSGSKKSVCATA